MFFIFNLEKIECYEIIKKKNRKKERGLYKGLYIFLLVILDV